MFVCSSPPPKGVVTCSQLVRCGRRLYVACSPHIPITRHISCLAVSQQTTCANSGPLSPTTPDSTWSQMASYMILSALSGKGPLSPDVTGQALTALVCKPCQGGLEPSLLCALAVVQVRLVLSRRCSGGRLLPPGLCV